MFKSRELPDCLYRDQPIVVPPCRPTPRHLLYLSDLDDQKFLRFSIKYLYIFEKSLPPADLRASLSRVLVDYYPLAGRLRTSSEDDGKLEVDCSGQGALFVEASMEITGEEFLEVSERPNRSWRKLLYKVEAPSFLEFPPLVIKVTKLRCGGMIMCTAINHCLCDGIGTSKFLDHHISGRGRFYPDPTHCHPYAWTHLTTKPNLDLSVDPFHSRHLLKHPGDLHPSWIFPNYPWLNDHSDTDNYLQGQPIVPVSVTFSASHILRLKRSCVPSQKCTTFEALAAHTWRSWVKSLGLSPLLYVKLLFSVNVRDKLYPGLPQGYSGNGFVLGWAETAVKNLVSGESICNGVKLVQKAKSSLSDDENVRSIIDLLEDKTVKTDLSNSLVISQWSKLGLEELDFGQGRALHMGPLTSDVYCLFLPVTGDVDAVRVLLSVPESVAGSLEYYLKEVLDANNDSNVDSNGFHDVLENGFGFLNL